MLMNRTELNCETFEKVSPEDAEDFVAVCEDLAIKQLPMPKNTRNLVINKQQATTILMHALFSELQIMVFVE